MDEDGNISLPALDGTYNISEAPRALALHGYLGLRNEPEVTVEDNSASPITIGLPYETALIYGNITDTNGNPLTGVKVEGDNSNDGSGQSKSEGQPMQTAIMSWRWWREIGVHRSRIKTWNIRTIFFRPDHRGPTIMGAVEAT